ncbi:MAG: MFS transporter [Candidatus Giovannonibacteria bacterium]|nr:MAG: MFS transporter [Candidatus Giovannonibacteria bacterium]
MRIHINITVNRAVQILLVYLFAINVAAGLFGPLFAIFITGFIEGATLKTVGFALALYAIAKSVLQIPLAKVLDTKKGERDDFYILMAGALIEVLYPFALIFISQIWHLYTLEILAGFSSAALMASYYSLFARHVDKGAEGFEWSLFSVGGLTISSAIGAAIGGVLADIFGFRLLFILAGAINFVVFFVLIRLYPLLDGARPAALPPFTPIPKNPATKH